MCLDDKYGKVFKLILIHISNESSVSVFILYTLSIKYNTNVLYKTEHILFLKYGSRFNLIWIAYSL